MSDFHSVDPLGWQYDLQSVYSAYMGYFQLHSVPWHDQTWGQFFETFDRFLAFSWPVVIVTDARTGRAHIVTRMTSIAAFLKMIKARFGEMLPQVDNILTVKPFETSQRPLRHVNDWLTYKKLHSALPSVALAALKARVRSGEPNAIRELWATREKTFLAIDFECLERNDRVCIEWGYAAIRSNLLEAAGAWPPVPDTNYRKGHYIVSEYAEMSKASPSSSWQYAFGESQVIPKAKIPRIIQSVFSLVSPDSETVANNVVLVCHGLQAVMQRLDEMKIRLPSNMLAIDVAYLERALFTTGERGSMVDRKSGRARVPESLFSLRGLLHSFAIEPPCVLHNAGNDAFMALVAFQRMVDPKGQVGVGAHAIKGDPKSSANANLGKGRASNGNGHMKRAATVAARLFRPLGGSQVDLRKNGSVGNGTVGVAQARLGQDGADEMGMFVNMRRASVFSAFASPMLPTDKSKKRASNGSMMSGSGSGWLSPSMMSQKRQSVIEKRR